MATSATSNRWGLFRAVVSGPFRVASARRVDPPPVTTTSTKPYRDQPRRYRRCRRTIEAAQRDGGGIAVAVTDRENGLGDTAVRRAASAPGTTTFATRVSVRQDPHVHPGLRDLSGDSRVGGDRSRATEIVSLAYFAKSAADVRRSVSATYQILPVTSHDRPPIAGGEHESPVGDTRVMCTPPWSLLSSGRFT